MRLPTWLLAGAALFFGTACSDFLNKFTVNSTAPVLKIAATSMDAESDVQLARQAAPANLKTVDGFLAASPENTDLLEIVSQGYAQYAFGFLEDDLEVLGDKETPERAALVQRCTNFYDRSHAIALRLVATNYEDFPKAVKGDGATFDKELARTKKKAAIGLYWAGLSLGSAINLHRDDIDRVAELPRAIAMLERAHTLDPDYFNHGAALTLGVVYASQGKAMGGDPEKAKALFKEVTDATQGKFLMAKVLYARFYATITQDRPLFESTLKEVLATPSNVWPEQRLANELAKIRAARYLKQADDLF